MPSQHLSAGQPQVCIIYLIRVFGHLLEVQLMSYVSLYFFSADHPVADGFPIGQHRPSQWQRLSHTSYQHSKPTEGMYVHVYIVVHISVCTVCNSLLRRLSDTPCHHEVGYTFIFLSQLPVRMRIRLSYNISGTSIQEQGEVNNFPPELVQ